MHTWLANRARWVGYFSVGVVLFSALWPPGASASQAVAQVGNAGTRAQVAMALVSGASDGSDGNGFAGQEAVSPDGRYVAFESEARNLVLDDTNNANDIFVQDRLTGLTTRASVATDGSQAASSVYAPAISNRGRYVAFYSYATNLVSDDTNLASDVFVHDSLSGQTTRVSIASDGTQANGASFFPSISANGRFVAFISYATNLVSNDTNGLVDIFVHDRLTGSTVRASVASDGTQANSESYDPKISGNGLFVTFDSNATNLVDGDTNGNQDVFIRDLLLGQTMRVSLAWDGAEGNSGSGSGVITNDGRYVAFESYASNLVTGDTNSCTDYPDGHCADIFVRDRQTGQTTRASVASDGTQGNDDASGPTISDDGRYVAFQSRATNLVSGDLNSTADIFLRDRATSQTTRISVAASGVEGNGDSLQPSISSNGRFVGFYSIASNLVTGDTNGTGDVFVYTRP